MEKRNADDWDGLRMERLATAYMGLKREMWSILADACGEKWTVVEAKVCPRNQDSGCETWEANLSFIVYVTRPQESGNPCSFKCQARTPCG